MLFQLLIYCSYLFFKATYKTLLIPTAKALDEARPLPEEGISAIVVNSMPFLILNIFKPSLIISCFIFLLFLHFQL